MKKDSMQGGGKGTKNRKQVMTKPQKKVDGHEKRRKEEGQGGDLAVPCKQRLPPGAGAARSADGVYREVCSRRVLGALGARGLSPLDGLMKTRLRAHAFYEYI